MKKKRMLLPILTFLVALALLLAEHIDPEAGCIRYNGYPNLISVMVVFFTAEALIASVCALIFRRGYWIPALFGGAAAAALIYEFAAGQNESIVSVITAAFLGIFLVLAVSAALFTEEQGKKAVSQEKTARLLRYLALAACAGLLLAELLPTSVVDMMFNGPDNPGIPMYGSYFHYIGFGYGNVFPLLAGIFTVHALVFALWAAIAKRGCGLQAVFGGLVLLCIGVEVCVLGARPIFGTAAAILAAILAAVHFGLALAATFRQRTNQ
ncbi:MAG: hypothetical protein HFG44_07305 [Oscillospiraceae bacterium]|nr:hypothetical protein [Oscillospiraceae bacterium]